MENIWALEHDLLGRGYRTVAGVDEAGRGPLAGPVVAAAVILPSGMPDIDIDDSKKLEPETRETLYEAIYSNALTVGIGIIDAGHIDRINILQASLAAMAIALANLAPQPDFVLVDGLQRVPRYPDQEPLVKGDSRSVSVAAASIVAKVTRDRLMVRYHLDYPQFGFDLHKGYATPAHRAAILDFGCCPIHRRSFRGVAAQQLPVFPE